MSTKFFPKTILKKKRKILFVSAEAAPFAQVGGLGAVMFSLPLALRKLNEDVRLTIPCYGKIDLKKYPLETEIKNLKVPTGKKQKPEFLVCNVKKYFNKEVCPTYFLENVEYYEKRANIYGYADDCVRWALFCRGVIEFLKQTDWIPDIIVCSDWQTGLLPNYLKTVYKKESKLSKIKLVMAIHNLSYQGVCDFRFVPESERDSGREPIPDFFNPRLAKLNWLLRGILYSDVIVTVSPTYAKEILTPKCGEGLEKVLNEKRDKIFGILNGLDERLYNPSISPFIPYHYTPFSLERKKKNKNLLQKKFGLEEGDKYFLVGMPSRLTEQKGFDLLERILDKVLRYLPIQFIFLGDGESRYKTMLKKIAESFERRIGYQFEFDSKLPHLLYAGSDATMIPSKFEPCGIVQMEAMRYGSVPIARKTGGLADTIENFQPDKEKGDGFLFGPYQPYALFATLCKAQTIYTIPGVWKRIMRRAMKKDFSWKKSAKQYISIFKALLK